MYGRILIVVSDRDEARAALDEGLALAKVHGSNVLLLCVVPRYDAGVVAEMGVIPVGINEDAERELRAHAQQLLGEAKAQAERAGVPSETLVESGDAVLCITTVARERRCDLIVAGTEQHNAVMRILTGSAIPGLITQAPVPVLICHQRATDTSATPA